MKNSPYRTKNYKHKQSKNIIKWYKIHKHPKGMLGKKQSKNAIEKSRERCKKRIGNKHPYWKGKTQPYWNKIARTKVNNIPNICEYGKKNNFKCKGKIIVHHKDGDVTNNNKKNLIKTCVYHHITHYHKKRIKRMIENMNKRRLEKMKENPKWWSKIMKNKNKNSGEKK
jgi:hypothetical protein